jgi:hypothetical protein
MKNSLCKALDIKTLFQLYRIAHTQKDSAINTALEQYKYSLLKYYNADNDYTGIVLKSVLREDIIIIIHKAVDYNNHSYKFFDFNENSSFSSLEVCGTSQTRTEHALNLVRTVMRENKNAQIIQFGYSDAGFIAEYVYGALESNIDTIMVDSPGALELLKTNYPNFEYLLYQKKGKFQYYCSSPNAFNTASEHIVPVGAKYYLVHINDQYHYGIGFVDYLNFSVKRHDFDTLTKYVSNNDNISLLSPGKWPSNILEGYEYYISTNNEQYLQEMVKNKILPLIVKNRELTEDSIKQFNELYGFFKEKYLIKDTDTINPKYFFVEATTNFDNIASSYLEECNNRDLSRKGYIYKAISFSYYCCCCCIAIPIKLLGFLFCNKATQKDALVTKNNFIPLATILENLDNIEYSNGEMKVVDNKIFSIELIGDYYLSINEGGSHES